VSAPAATQPRALGLWSATALVVGSMIGSGVFLLPASLAPYGAASLLGWGITLTGAILLASTFSRLSARWPQTGGPYVYARNAFGDLPGFAVACRSGARTPPLRSHSPAASARFSLR
jgi:APA family basic amino acid/polyamine antiporter